jgi:hypothetical protein
MDSLQEFIAVAFHHSTKRTDTVKFTPSVIGRRKRRHKSFELFIKKNIIYTVRPAVHICIILTIAHKTYNSINLCIYSAGYETDQKSRKLANYTKVSENCTVHTRHRYLHT